MAARKKGITRRKKKQTSHDMGLPCNGCNGVIWPDETYLEITLPSEIKQALCVICIAHEERSGR